MQWLVMAAADEIRVPIARPKLATATINTYVASESIQARHY